MDADIYYFTGTGNTLHTVRRIGALLSGCSRILPIKKYREHKKVEVKSDLLIIAYPVYFQTLPRIVRSFVKKLVFNSASVPIYGIATCNGGPGYSLFTLSRLLRKKGQTLKAGFTIKMPGNSLIIRDFTNPTEERARRLEESEKKIDRISNSINARQFGPMEGEDGLQYHLQGIVTGVTAKYLYKTPSRFKTTKGCLKCRTCVKICPINNIELTKDGVKWGNNCEHCLACFHWCPVKAIEMGKNTTGKLRYHHPEISIHDM